MVLDPELSDLPEMNSPNPQRTGKHSDLPKDLCLKVTYLCPGLSSLLYRKTHGWDTLHLAPRSAVWFCLARLTEDVYPLAAHDSSLNPQSDCRPRAVSMIQHFLSRQARELSACFPAWDFSCEPSTGWGHWYPGPKGPHFRHMLFWTVIFLRSSSSS